jgi:hypothetical protein
MAPFPLTPTFHRARRVVGRPPHARNNRDSNGRTIWIVDAHRGDGQRFVMRAEEKVTAFLELERITRESSRFQSAE